MLKKVRIVLASVFFAGITLLFIGIGADWWGWMAQAQFLPSVLRVIGSATALNIGVLAALLLLTYLFGRIYCSTICPLGVLQDLSLGIRRTLDKWTMRKGHRTRKTFSYSPERSWLRYSVLVLFIICMVIGLQFVASLIAPYAAYGRIVRSIVDPTKGVVVVGLVSLVLIVTLSVLWGRTWCSNICPVGTTLGLISRRSLWRIRIDTDKCTGCKACERVCKASCIDAASHKIDSSRCVDCFDCLGACKTGALQYSRPPIRSGVTEKHTSGVTETPHVIPGPDRESKDSQCCHLNKETPDQVGGDGKAQAGGDRKALNVSTRRAFLTGTALAAGAVTLGAQVKKLDGGLAILEAKKEPERTGRLVPPGALGERNFYSHCIGCQLCISACPNGVLKPSTDLDHLMQPVMSYTDGYCRPECTECSKVCPTGAIIKITSEQKTDIHIGTATVSRDLCVVTRDGVSCGNCSRHCPTSAIEMVHQDPQDALSPLIPSINEQRCIGCGACEYVCPSRPYSAIHVNALNTHING